MSKSKENANGGNNEEPVFNIGDIVSGFKLVKKIDEGGFGQVFKVTKDDKTFYAMKLESNSQEGGSAIKLEINVLKQLPKDTVFPGLISGGKKVRYHYLVLELLGDNLKMLKSRSPNPEVWSDGTWSRIGIQCLYALKVMHDAGFVHRDVKPNNFAIGINTAAELRSRRVLLFDFGLARKFIRKVAIPEGGVSKKAATKSKAQSSTNLQKAKSRHVQNGRKDAQKNMQKNIQRQFLVGPKEGPSQRTVEEKLEEEGYAYRIPRPHTDFRGTHQYASPNAHLQIELGRHDDIWSLMYMAAEFIVELPWSSNDEIPVEDIKNQSSLLRLFTDENNPMRLTSDMRRQLNDIDKMLKSMNYYDHPNYEIVYQFFRDVMNKAKVTWDTPFDWELGKGDEVSKAVKGRKRNFIWENPGAFFKKSRWVGLKMPTMSPPASMKTSTMGGTGTKSVEGLRRNDFRRGKAQMSKEDSADCDDKLPTPAQKSMKKDPPVE